MARKKVSMCDYLAEEIIFKILSWLPVLSLLRVKSVCKSWKSIISDPQFIQAHLINSHKKQQPSSLLRVVSRGAFQDMYIDTRGEDPVRLTLPSYLSGMHLHIRSCNGLVSLADIYAGVIYIWNPLTRLFKLLPRPKIQQHFFSFGFAINLGFGFDSVSNDYKILRIVFGKISYDNDDVDIIVAELYSTNADSWKEIRVPKTVQGFKRYPLSKCVNVGSGVLYFEGMDEILSFDLHEEVFGLYQYPKGKRMSDVLGFDGSIAVILKSGGWGSVLSLWMLDDVCGKLTWTKKFNIEPDLKIDWVLLYLGDGQFVAEDFHVGYMFYDDRKKENKKFPLIAPIGECMSVVQFTESIVSLEGFERRE